MSAFFLTGRGPKALEAFIQHCGYTSQIDLREGEIKDKAITFIEKTLEKEQKTRSGPRASPP
jgi:hypothetical protein